MYSIGELSKITGLTVKSLRFYQERGLLDPTYVDEQTGYRYYSEPDVDRAAVIRRLRDLEFSVKEIAEILATSKEETDILAFLERRKSDLREEISHRRNILGSIDQIITNIKEFREAMSEASNEIVEKTIEPMVVAGMRMRGRYSECGKGFSKIGKSYGFQLSGKPMCLIYDEEYKEEDANFEPCMPIKSDKKKVDGIDVRELPGGRCVSLIHHGPYDELSPSYAKLLHYVKEKGLKVLSPCREVYIKGPGMIFKGNPKKYVTELQFFVCPEGEEC